MATSQFVTEVGQADFQAAVLDRSSQVPVVVDFWAPWCGPCRQLGPLLEELAEAANGRWILAKINSDENPNLAAAYGVRGIPYVLAFVDGVVVDHFTGALPRPEVEAFLQRMIPTEADKLAREALAAAHDGDRDLEYDRWCRLLEIEPASEIARVRRARLLLAAGDVNGARADLDHVPDHSEFFADAQNLRRFAEWGERVHAAGGAEVVRERAAAEPDQVARRFDFGCALAVQGDFEGALSEFLEVVRRDRGFEEDAGRKAMVALFGVLGDEHDLTSRFRHLLAMELY